MTPQLYVIAFLLFIIVICLFVIAGLMGSNSDMRQIIVDNGLTRHLPSTFRLMGIRS